MDLSSIVKVAEVAGANEANRYIETGWVYLGQATHALDGSDACIVYSLGWPSEKGSVLVPDAPTRKVLD